MSKSQHFIFVFLKHLVDLEANSKLTTSNQSQVYSINIISDRYLALVKRLWCCHSTLCTELNVGLILQITS